MAVDANGNPLLNLRDVATQKGLTVDWNAEQGVLINGTPINSQGLTNYGVTPPTGSQPNTFYGTQQQVNELLSPYTNIGLRDYATQKGLNVGWNAEQGALINGNPINTQGLTNYGATPPTGSQPNAFYGTQGQIDQLLAPYMAQQGGATIPPPIDPNVPPPVNPAVTQAATDYQTWVKQPYVAQYAPQIESLIKNILSRQFSYDPKNDAQFQQASQELTRNVMETMNSRGILNSTITENQVQQGVGNLLPQYQQIAKNAFQDEGNVLMSQVDMLMGVDETQYGRYQDQGANYLNAFNVVSQMDDTQYNRWKDAYTMRYNTERDKIADEQTALTNQRNAVNDAWNETDKLGYVSNAASLVLGVNPGTPSQSVREATTLRLQQLEDQATQFDQDLIKIEQTYQNNSALSTQSYYESSSLSAQSSAQQNQNSINAENRADAREAANPKTLAETGLSTNGKALLAQINTDAKSSKAPVKAHWYSAPVATKDEMDSANADAKIKQALDYGTITEGDAVILALQLGLTIKPDTTGTPTEDTGSSVPANVIAPTVTGGAEKW